MKKLYFLTIFAVSSLVYSNTFGQQVRTKTGFGYYETFQNGDKANILYSDITIRLSSGLFIGGGLGMSDLYTTYDDDSPLLAGLRSIRNFYHFRFLLDYELAFGTQKRHLIGLGSGLTYIHKRFSEPEVSEDLRTGKVTVQGFQPSSYYDEAGLLLRAEYGFAIGKFIIGTRTEIHYLISYGFGGLVLSPQIGIRF